MRRPCQHHSPRSGPAVLLFCPPAAIQSHLTMEGCLWSPTCQSISSGNKANCLPGLAVFSEFLHSSALTSCFICLGRLVGLLTRSWVCQMKPNSVNIVSLHNVPPLSFVNCANCLSLSATFHDGSEKTGSFMSFFFLLLTLGKVGRTKLFTLFHIHTLPHTLELCAELLKLAHGHFVRTPPELFFIPVAPCCIQHSWRYLPRGEGSRHVTKNKILLHLSGIKNPLMFANTTQKLHWLLRYTTHCLPKQIK